MKSSSSMILKGIKNIVRRKKFITKPDMAGDGVGVMVAGVSEFLVK